MRRRSSTITTAARGRRRARAVRPKTVAEKAFCALGPTAEAFITGAAAAGNTRLGPELAELNTLAAAHGERAVPRRPGPGGRVRPLAGRGRAVHPRRRHRNTQPTTAGDALVLELPRRPDPPAVRLRPRTGARPPARRVGSRRERGRAGAGAGSRRRAAPAQAGRDAPTRPGTAAHREDPAVGTRGAAAHPGRGRDHRPGRLQRPHPAQDRGVPGHQDPRRVRPRRVLDQRRPPSTTSPAWNGSPRRENLCPGRAGRHRQVPPARRARRRRRRTPGTGSATSPPPSWSRPSTAAWPTTASAASSTPCSATT